MRKILFIVILFSLVLFIYSFKDFIPVDKDNNSNSEENVAKTKSEKTDLEKINFDLQKAIDEEDISGDGIVNVPQGEIIINKTIILKSGIHLKGAGIGKTVIKANAETMGSGTDQTKMFVVVDHSKDIKISDITFDGVKEERKDLVNDPYAHAIVFSYASDFLIEHIEIINAPSGSLMLYNSKDGTVNECRIEDSGSNGILAMQDTKNLKIINNYIKNTDHQNGIFISYQEGKSSSDILIEGNQVMNAGDFGIEVGHIVEAGDEQHENIVVRNNEVLDSRNAGIAFRTVSHGVIENNYIEGYGETGGYGGDGIFVEGGYNQSTDVKVLNNIVLQNYESGDANGIYVTGLEDTIIEGNRVSKSRGKALFIQASKIGESTPDFPDGLRLIRDITVKNNKFLNSQKEGIHIQGQKSSNISISDNMIHNNKEHGILIANLEEGNGLKVTNNDVSENGHVGLEIYSQEDFTIEGNYFASNGKKAKEEEQKSAIRLVSIGEGELINNVYEDSQEKATQLYYLQISQATATVSQSGKELSGGTSKLINETHLYTEI